MTDFSVLYRNAYASDAAVVIDGERVPAHTIVLAFASRMLAVLWRAPNADALRSDNSIAEDGDREFSFDALPVAPEAAHAYLRLCYNVADAPRVLVSDAAAADVAVLAAFMMSERVVGAVYDVAFGLHRPRSSHDEVNDIRCFCCECLEHSAALLTPEEQLLFAIRHHVSAPPPARIYVACFHLMRRESVGCTGCDRCGPHSGTHIRPCRYIGALHLDDVPLEFMTHACHAATPASFETAMLAMDIPLTWLVGRAGRTAPASATPREVLEWQCVAIEDFIASCPREDMRDYLARFRLAYARIIEEGWRDPAPAP